MIYIFLYLNSSSTEQMRLEKPYDVDDWDVDQVTGYFSQYEWFTDETAQTIRDKRIDGFALQTISKNNIDELFPYCISNILNREIEDLKKKKCSYTLSTFDEIER
jgi:hypothetical protein